MLHLELPIKKKNTLVGKNVLKYIVQIKYNDGYNMT